jgi:phage terminase large subunit-like protein
MSATAATELMQRGSDGQWQPRFHRGQWRAWESTARFIAVLAGTQSGKTVFGPHWLLREIKERGPGDYMIVSPTFPLLELKALVEFKRLFIDHLRLGTYVANPIRRFVFSEEGMRATHPGWVKGMAKTQVFFGYADNPDSLESATLKGVWCDEAGQKAFKLGSYEALRRRTSLYQGRILFTTTAG